MSLSPGSSFMGTTMDEYWKAKERGKAQRPNMNRPLEAPNQMQGREFLQGQMNTPQPTRIAGLSEMEQQGLAGVNRYAQQDPRQDPSFQLGASELANTLTGQYDPNTSQFYQGARAGMQRNLESGLDLMSQRQNMGGQLYGGRGDVAAANLIAQSGEGMNRVLGGLAETERGYRAQAAPQMLNLGKYLQDQPLQQAQAQMQYGALPRNIEQAGYNAQTQDIVNRQGLAQTMLGYSPTYMPGNVYQDPSQSQDEQRMVEELVNRLSGMGGPPAGGNPAPRPAPGNEQFTRPAGGGLAAVGTKPPAQIRYDYPQMPTRQPVNPGVYNPYQNEYDYNDNLNKIRRQYNITPQY